MSRRGPEMMRSERARYARAKRRRPTDHKGAKVCIMAAMLLMLVSLAYQSRNMLRKIDEYKVQEEQLARDIQKESERAEEIKELEAYMDTDEFKEKAARDKLGLVYPDEILLKPEK